MKNKFRVLSELTLGIALKRMKDERPASMSKSRLRDLHHKTHLLYGAAKRRKPPNRMFINTLVDLHDSFVREMLKRGMNHKTPLKKI